jgi:hypothetical protein
MQHTPSVPDELPSRTCLDKFLIQAVVVALKPESWEECGLDFTPAPTPVEINALTRHVRDVMRTDSRPGVNRQHLGYLVRLLMRGGNFRTGLAEAEVRTLIGRGLVERARSHGLVDDPDNEFERIDEWLDASVRQENA